MNLMHPTLSAAYDNLFQALNYNQHTSNAFPSSYVNHFQAGYLQYSRFFQDSYSNASSVRTQAFSHLDSAVLHRMQVPYSAVGSLPMQTRFNLQDHYTPLRSRYPVFQLRDARNSARNVANRKMAVTAASQMSASSGQNLSTRADIVAMASMKCSRSTEASCSVTTSVNQESDVRCSPPPSTTRACAVTGDISPNTAEVPKEAQYKLPSGTKMSESDRAQMTLPCSSSPCEVISLTDDDEISPVTTSRLVTSCTSVASDTECSNSFDTLVSISSESSDTADEPRIPGAKSMTSLLNNPPVTQCLLEISPSAAPDTVPLLSRISCTESVANASVVVTAKMAVSSCKPHTGTAPSKASQAKSVLSTTKGSKRGRKKGKKKKRKYLETGLSASNPIVIDGDDDDAEIPAKKATVEDLDAKHVLVPVLSQKGIPGKSKRERNRRRQTASGSVPPVSRSSATSLTGEVRPWLSQPLLPVDQSKLLSFNTQAKSTLLTTQMHSSLSSSKLPPSSATCERSVSRPSSAEVATSLSFPELSQPWDSQSICTPTSSVTWSPTTTDVPPPSTQSGHNPSLLPPSSQHNPSNLLQTVGKASRTMKSLSAVDWSSLDLEDLLQCHTTAQYKHRPLATVHRAVDPNVLLQDFDDSSPPAFSSYIMKRSTQDDVKRIFSGEVYANSEQDVVDLPLLKEELQQFEERKRLALELDKIVDDVIVLD